jgi:hypothetical protein
MWLALKRNRPRTASNSAAAIAFEKAGLSETFTPSILPQAESSDISDSRWQVSEYFDRF